MMLKILVISKSYLVLTPDRRFRCGWVSHRQCLAHFQLTMSRTTFQVDDWIIHTPKSILAKNFGIDESVFNTLPASDPYILPPTSISTADVSDPYGETDFIYKLSKLTPPTVPGGGGTLSIIDSHVFPIATTIAAAVVKLEPGGLRELHWHPNVRAHILPCCLRTQPYIY